MAPRIALTLLFLFSTTTLQHVIASPALAQSSAASMSIDSPYDGASVSSSDVMNIAGWAADGAGSGTGVDEVAVYADGPRGSGIFVNDAFYGTYRPDVANALGDGRFASSGFSLSWTPSILDSGSHTLYIYSHSVVSGWTYQIVHFTVYRPVVEHPYNPPCCIVVHDHDHDHDHGHGHEEHGHEDHGHEEHGHAHEGHGRGR